jgi:protein-arginine kinase activator protein McsA
MALNTKIFIERSINKHGNKYDYSRSVYKTSSTPIEIICPEHGEFLQKPDYHMNGSGCPRCNKWKINTQKEIINRFLKIHGNKYDYSKVKYLKTNLDVEIVCPKHGSFFQQPLGHFRGQGCPKCYNEKSRRNQSDVIEDFKKVHGDKYDYSKVKYFNSKNKIEIICSKHGSFFQLPDIHKQGSGCPKCKNSLGENKIRNYLEENNIEYIQEKTFKDCKFKKVLPFDFYLPELNTVIEFDGEQHFKKVDYFGGEETFKNTKIRDFIKNEYCKNNNIPIIRIPYYYFNNIEEFLEYKL